MRWLGYHHRLNGHEFEQTLGDSEGQGRLVCCSLWGHRVGHDLTTEHTALSLTNNNNKIGLLRRH